MMFLILVARIHDKKNRPATDVPVDESTSQSVRGTPPSVSISLEHKTKLNSISGTQTEGGSDASGVTLKSETVGKKAFALQDKVRKFFLLQSSQCIFVGLISVSFPDKFGT